MTRWTGKTTSSGRQISTPAAKESVWKNCDMYGGSSGAPSSLALCSRSSSPLAAFVAPRALRLSSKAALTRQPSAERKRLRVTRPTQARPSTTGKTERPSQLSSACRTAATVARGARRAAEGNGAQRSAAVTLAEAKDDGGSASKYGKPLATMSCSSSPCGLKCMETTWETKTASISGGMAPRWFTHSVRKTTTESVWRSDPASRAALPTRA
mmetsp:Transcript_32646/g.92833  ORF Transcript_32646/g.92833 Transcript_32646/m.92833 type:complete len:212 (+) Transcript_32646:272-907(+)